MPWTEKQRALFNAAAHNKTIAREHGMNRGSAAELADEANHLKKEGRERPAIKSFIDLEPTLYPAGRRSSA